MSTGRGRTGDVMGGIVGIGECVVDFLPGDGDDATGTSLSFVAHPGGSVANLCVVAARMGATCSFVGAVGRDAFGHFLQQTLDGFGVDTGGMVYTEECGTGLVFVTNGENHEKIYTYANVPGADKMLRPEQVSERILADATVWHFSSNACSSGHTLATQRALMKQARREGKVVSFDVNYRPNNHRRADEALAMIRGFAAMANVVKVTGEELVLLADDTEAAGAGRLLEQGADVVLVTRGGDGADFYAHSGNGHVDGRTVDVVDTTGAGDNFLGGFLVSMLEQDGFGGFPVEAVRNAVLFGNTVASLSVTKWGAMTSVPSRAEVDMLVSIMSR